VAHASAEWITAWGPCADEAKSLEVESIDKPRIAIIESIGMGLPLA